MIRCLNKNTLFVCLFLLKKTESLSDIIFVISQYDVLQTSPVIPWSNIRIQAPQSFVESGYREDICDFWDALGFYEDSIETTSSSIDESTILTSTLETKLTTNEETTQDQVGETTFESGMESTTTGSSATLKINNFVLSLSFMFVCLLKLI